MFRLTVVLVLVFLASPALGQVPSAEHAQLNYRGALTCVDAASFRNLVAAGLDGHDPFTANAPTIVNVTLHRRGPGSFDAEVSIDDATGHHPHGKLVEADCTALVDDVVAVVVVWLLPVLPPAPPQAPPAPVPLPEARPAPVPPSAPVPPPEGPPALAKSSETSPVLPPQASLAYRFVVSGWADYATARLITPGGSVSAGVRSRRFSAAVEGRWNPPAPLQLGNGHVDHVARLTGSLLLCGHVAWFTPCALGEASRIQFSGTSPDAAYAAPRYAVGVRFGADLPLPIWRRQIFVQTAVDLLGSFGPNIFDEAANTVIEPSSLRFNVGLGLGLLIEIPSS